MRETLDLKHQYINSIYVKEDKVLSKIRSSVPKSIQHMQVSAYEGSLLSFLTLIAKPKTIVEIGTLVGYSAACMSKSMLEDSNIICIEKNIEYANIAKINLSALDVKFKIICGDAIEVLPEINCDMVFIDADKINYCKYLDWSEKHVSKNGMIVADNTFLFGDLWHKERKFNTKSMVMNEFNNRITDITKYHSIVLPTEDGMSASIKIT